MLAILAKPAVASLLLRSSPQRQGCQTKYRFSYSQILMQKEELIMLNSELVFKKQDGIVVTPLDDCYLIFPNHTDETNKPYLCKVNKTAYAIFEYVDGIMSVADIIAVMINRYDEQKAEIEADVYEILENLEDKKIVKRLANK
ncbi:MAG: PqqD family protein [Oscillospiraceae bacterium]|nr:PqqD family protein [Oscillospiraceae bacterium]